MEKLTLVQFLHTLRYCEVHRLLDTAYRGTDRGFSDGNKQGSSSDLETIAMVEQVQALVNVLEKGACDLRSCNICGLTVDVSKPYVAPDINLSDMRGGRGCYPRKKK